MTSSSVLHVSQRRGGVVMSTIVKTLVLCGVLLSAVSGDRYHPVDPTLRSSGTPNARETVPEFWSQQAQAAIESRLRARSPGGRARNVVLFIGDGMSLPTITAARILHGQRSGATGEEAELFFETFPTTGLVKTYCTNSQVPDSACTATAYLCGVKTNTGCIGVSAAVVRGDCAAARNPANQFQCIAQWALEDGRDAGIVTTARVTHASPAGAYAKVPERGWEHDAAVRNARHNPHTCPDIAYQLVHMHPGNSFKVILGGGRCNFLPKESIDEEGSKGIRRDGRDLIKEWQQDKADRHATYNYIWNRAQLLDINENLPEYVLGLFESSHMQYNLQANSSTEPTLAELTETAVKMLRRNQKGFFLLVEGGRIDHAHHQNHVQLALDETIQLSAAVARAADLLSEEDSLLVVTADHAHVMSFNGYSHRGQDILGPSANKDKKNVTYMTLSYSNGPGARVHARGIRPDVARDADFRSVRWRSHAEFPLVSETHGGEDVAVFARGPRHTLFSGVYEQSQLPHRMARAACFGPSRHACATKLLLPRDPAPPQPHLSAILVVLCAFNQPFII